MLYDTKKISNILNTNDVGIIVIDLSKDLKWDCYGDQVINHKKNTASLYWKSLNDKERKDRLKNHGMCGKKHTKKTRELMSKSAMGTKKPSLHKGGKLIKDDRIVEFSCLSHFCKENNLSTGHICELLQGKRKSVKGWRNVV